MGAIRTILVMLLLFLNFIGALYLETRMVNNFSLELVLIIFGILVSVIAVLGIGFNTRWAWPLSTILFSAYLANAVFLYYHVHGFLVFSGLLFVNLLGLLVSVISIREEDDFFAETTDTFPLDTYEGPSSVVYKTQKTAKKRKKKK